MFLILAIESLSSHLTGLLLIDIFLFCQLLGYQGFLTDAHHLCVPLQIVSHSISFIKEQSDISSVLVRDMGDIPYGNSMYVFIASIVIYRSPLH